MLKILFFIRSSYFVLRKMSIYLNLFTKFFHLSLTINLINFKYNLFSFVLKLFPYAKSMLWL